MSSKWLDNQWDDRPDPTPDEPLLTWVYHSGKQAAGSFSIAMNQLAQQLATSFGVLPAQVKKQFTLWPPPEKPEPEGDKIAQPYVKPPHSMTPPGGRVFDRRGKKRY